MSSSVAEMIPVDSGGTKQSSIDNVEKSGPTSGSNNISAILEAANSIRKETENENGAAPTATTINDIANAFSEGDDMIYEPHHNDHEEEEDSSSYSPFGGAINNKPKVAYTEQTAAAISSLMKGEKELLVSSNSNSNMKSKSSNEKDISLQDRAHAMISVYKDYILSEEEKEQDLQTINYDYPLLETKRKEEIKLVTLEKFCNGSSIAIGSANGNKEEASEDDDDDKNYDNDDDDISEDSHTKLNSRSYIEPHTKRKKQTQRKVKLHGLTAASTTAAFRLKAEVALKAVGSAAGKVKDKVTKTDNDKNDIMAATVENEHDFQDYVGDDNDNDEIQNERQDDLEYGIANENDFMVHEQLLDNDDNNDAEEESGGGVYGMHILDRDNSLKRGIKSDDDEIEAVGIFNDLCDELGVTPNTHPGLHNGLHHFYHHPRLTRYKYPIFRTKKFKQTMFYFGILILVLLISVAVISAISNGFEEVRQKKANPLPDWHIDDEWREKQKEDWDKDHPSADISGGDRPTHPGITNQQKLFQKVSDAYRPVWYDRSTGWTGQTYKEALTWCDSHSNYIPCPYEVYCPDEKTLLSAMSSDGSSGNIEDDGETWAP